MTKHYITKNSSKPLVVTSNNDEWIIVEGVTLTATNAATIRDTSSDGNFAAPNTTFTIRGTLDGPMGLLMSSATNLTFNIAETGDATGDLRSNGYGFEMTNWGSRTGDTIVSNKFIITNHADWHGEFQLFADANGKIVNGKQGSIAGGDQHDALIDIYHVKSGAVALVNNGTITDNGTVGAIISVVSATEDSITNRGFITGDINLGDGKDRLVNRHNIEGKISMGAGADVLDLRSSAVKGQVWGGLDNDSYYINNKNNEIHEGAGQGADTVYAALNYKLGANFENLRALGHADLALTGNGLANKLSGNDGNNRLAGQAGDDTLTGAGGNDVLLGGKGNDEFVFFGTGTGTDRIKDFTLSGDDADTISLLLVPGFKQFTNVTAHLAENADGDAVLALGKGARVIFEGIDMDNLTAQHFHVTGSIEFP